MTRLSDVVEIHQLMGDLMDPEQQAEALADGYATEVVETVRADLLADRLEAFEVTAGTPLPDIRPIAPTCLAGQSVGDFLDLIAPTTGREVCISRASIATAYPWTETARRWAALTGGAKLKPLPEAMHGKLVEYLHGLDKMEGAEKKATAHFGFKVTRKMVRDHTRGTRPEGRPPKSK